MKHSKIIKLLLKIVTIITILLFVVIGFSTLYVAKNRAREIDSIYIPIAVEDTYNYLSGNQNDKTDYVILYERAEDIYNTTIDGDVVNEHLKRLIIILSTAFLTMLVLVFMSQMYYLI